MEENIIRAIEHALVHTPTREQASAIATFARFLTCGDARSMMILSGAAGTGKTSLASAMVRAMHGFGVPTLLMAPTGRAAKVFSLSSGTTALTIHRTIYRQRRFDGTGGVFDLNFNKHKNALFFVDESSMIANDERSGSAFGTGRLLDDLVQFVYGSRGCRMVVIGDTAQLPPVGESLSPAMSSDTMSTYGLSVYTATLGEVLRQSQQSGILYNATLIRSLLAHDERTLLPKIVLSGFADIMVVPPSELIDTMASSYSEVGIDETIVVTRSNKRANAYNRGVRVSVLDRESEFSGGDMVMIVKNNYFWLDHDKQARDGSSAQAVSDDFIANGDRAIVHRVRNVEEVYGLRFADATLSFPDYDDRELTAKVMLTTLTSDSPSLSREQGEMLFQAIWNDYAHVRLKEVRLRKVREDAYFNALQIKFAYAVTCHKAQGGQWAHVYLDQGFLTTDMLGRDYIHWLYTAFTRATEKLFLVGWPDAELAGQENS